MSRASKRRCLRDNFPVCEGSQNGTVEEGDDKNQAANVKYFAVRQDASQVEMRVQYEGKDIGRFTHRINPTEKSRWVKANFLVELITHYGGRKPTKGRSEYQDMNIRSLHEVFHEVFQALPSKFPETLVGFLNKYTPAKKAHPVPQEYRKFIIQTWKDKKDEVLRLYETRVQPTTSAHVVLDSRTDEMEIGEREAEFSRQTISQHSEIVVIDDPMQRMMNLDNRVMRLEKIVADLQAQLHERNKTCTNHDTISKDIEVPWQEHIDKCLSEQPLITREDANRVPSEVPDVEEENFQDLFLDDEYINKTWNLTGADFAERSGA